MNAYIFEDPLLIPKSQPDLNPAKVVS